MLPHDDPVRLMIGWVCVECRECWSIRLNDLRRLDGSISRMLLSMNGRAKFAAAMNSRMLLVWDDEQPEVCDG